MSQINKTLLFVKALPFLRILGLLLALCLASLGEYKWAGHQLQPGLKFFAVACVLCALSLEARRGKEVSTESMKMPLWLEMLLLASVIALATFLRLYRILEIPPGFFVDEMHQAIDGIHVLRGELRDPFGTGWYQVPSLYFFYIAVFFKLFGVSVWTMKFSTVFGAVLTLVPLYFLARHWFGKGVALALAVLLATTRWHLTMSRWGMVEVLPPLFGAAAFYFLARGISKGKAFPFALRFTKSREWDDTEEGKRQRELEQARANLCPSIWVRLFYFTLSGVVLGLSQYTYLAARLLPPIAVAFLLFVFLTRKRSFKSYLLPTFALLIGFCVTVGPLAHHFYQCPGEFFNRTNEVTMMKTIKEQHSLLPLWANIRKHLLMFGFAGDMNGRHNFPGMPMLSHVTNVLAFLGVAVALARILNPWRMLVVMWFVCTMAGGFLSDIREAPQGFRTLTAIPPILLFVGIFLDSAWSLLREVVPSKVRWQRIMLTSLGALLLLGIVAGSSYQDIRTYFKRQGLSQEVKNHYNMSASFVGKRLTELNENDSVYMWEGFFSNSICHFLNYDRFQSYRRFKRMLHIPLFPVTDGDIRLFGPDQWTNLDKVFKLFYPHTEMTGGYDPANNGLMFVEFRIPKADWEAISGATWEIVDASDSKRVLRSAVISQFGIFPETVKEITPELAQQGVSHRIYATLFVPNFRNYMFTAMRTPENAPPGNERVSVNIDGTERIDSFGKPCTLQLLPGRSSLEMIVENPVPGVGYYLRWDAQPDSNKPISRMCICRIGQIPYGLEGTYRRDAKNWSGPALSVRQDLFIEAMQDIGIAQSVEWNGRLVVPKTDRYQFSLKADDCATVWIGEQKVLSMEDPTGERANTIPLTAGEHPIRIQYYDEGGAQYLEIQWSQVGKPMAQFDYTSLLPPAK